MYQESIVIFFTTFVLYEINNRECELGYVTRVEMSVLLLPSKGLKTFQSDTLAWSVEKGTGIKLAY